jgi:uncharacterized membrane protein YfcA
MLTTLSYILGAVSGSLVGFSLGLIGGGGSILAVPLMLYVVGVRDPHLAIGTSAFAVAANAAMGLVNHARARNVNWMCGGVFAMAGIVGAYGGSTLGKAVNGQHLLLAFAILMLVIAGVMLRRKEQAEALKIACSKQNVPKVLSFGLLTGAFSGFFGIGGGFLIVPGLIAATGMGMLEAVGTSLVAVTAFGLTTAFNYAAGGMVDWPLASVFVVGGLLGTIGGARLAKKLSAQRGLLTRVFATVIVVVAIYMIWRSAGAS